MPHDIAASRNSSAGEIPTESSSHGASGPLEAKSLVSGFGDLQMFSSGSTLDKALFFRIAMARSTVTIGHFVVK